MNLQSLSSIPAIAWLVAGGFAASSSAAQAPAAVEPTHRPDFATAAEAARRAEVRFDGREDGTTWAVGADYKVGFLRSGAEYRPRLGARAEPAEVFALSPASIQVGDLALQCDGTRPFTRVGCDVSRAQSGFTERYVLAPGSLEQTFVFDALPARGEIRVRMPLETAFRPAQTPAGLEFRGPSACVTYSNAVAIDARGARGATTTRFVDGAIEIRVDAGFVETAELPLVIDPVVATLPLEGSASDAIAGDCVWNAAVNAWFVVFNRAFTATDFDVDAYTFDVDGNVLASAQVEASATGTGSWTNPRCAVLPAFNVALVVAEVTNVVPKVVLARRVVFGFGLIQTDPAILSLGGSTAQDLTAPDVGGDPYGFAPIYFCTAFTRTITATERDIGYRFVTPAGTLVGTAPTFFAHAAGTRESGVSISSHNAASAWTLAWQRTDAIFPNDGAIVAARLNWDSSLLTSPFVVVDTGLVERSPSVSSVFGGATRALIAYRQSTSTSAQGDIGLALLDGGVVLDVQNATALEGAGTQALDQTFPSIETDGFGALLTYSEAATTSAPADLFCAGIGFAGNAIAVMAAHLPLVDTPGTIARGRVAARQTGTATGRYLAIFDHVVAAGNRNVASVVNQMPSPGSIETYCYGDGSAAACPCGNSGAALHGCAQSASANGGFLQQSGGTATVATDTLVLQVSDVPTGTPCLFFQGTTALSGAPFGDGLLCLGGTITRLGISFAAGGVATSPAGLAVLGGVPAAGGMRAYQVWYRDSDTSFCTASTFNLSNGLIAIWAP